MFARVPWAADLLWPSGDTFCAVRKPRIGVVDQGTEKVRQYVEPLRKCGAEVEVLYWSGNRDPAADVGRFDALVLCGGDDIDARRFGEETHPKAVLDPPQRDEYEIELARLATAAAVPLLAVCRGAQVLNVALGGGVDQHIPDTPGRGEHADGAIHEIRIAEDSLLQRLNGSGGRRAKVNSFHHQAVGRPGPGVRVVARSPDGVAEAVEGPGPFCLGIQWHPERDGNQAPMGLELFRALVRAAVERLA